MRRPVTFLIVLVVLLFGAMPVLAASPSAASPGERALGVVPPRAQAASPFSSGTSLLTYHGGPVMTTNGTYAIFWGDNGSATFDSGYKALITQYLGDVAADNGKASNVYASDTQYYSTASSINTAIAYDSTYVASYSDTHPYPSSGCVDKATPGICLTDAQLQSEILAAMATNGWTATTSGRQNLFLLFTPRGVGSCYGNSCAYTQYCAYHSWIGGGSDAVLYANQPYGAQGYRIYTCDSGQRPNGNTADATLNLVSHEHNEAITDEQGSAWYDSRGSENGDKCAWKFGTALGGASGAKYNQAINGNHYYLQQEWSNAGPGCVLTFGG